MKDEDKTKKQLINELVELRQRVAELEALETECMQADSALQRREGLSSLLENISDIIAIINADGTLCFVSSSSEKVLGYKPEEVIGRNAFDFVHPDDLPSVVDTYNQGIRIPGYATSMEYRLQHKDGSWHTFEIMAKNLLDNPTVRGIVMIYRDITERKRAEEALRESEHNYRVLFESIIDGIVVIDAETMKIVLANETAAKMYGFDAVEELGDVNLLDYIHPDDRDRAMKIMVEDMFEKDLRQVNEFRTLTKDGRERWLSCVGTRTEYQGRLAGLGSFRDITERKQAEEVLRHRNRELTTLNTIGRALSQSMRLDNVLDTALDSALVTTGLSAGIIYLLDEAGRELVLAAHKGVSGEFAEAMGKLPVGMDIVGRVVKTGEITVTSNVLERADTSMRSAYELEKIQFAVSVPLKSNGRTMGVINLVTHSHRDFPAEDTQLLETIANEIAVAIENARLYEESKRAYAELQITQERLIQSEKFRALGEMASGIAHGFNNTLTAILAQTQLVLEESVDEQIREALQLVEKAAWDGAHTVRRIQEFARVRRDENYFKVDVNDIVKDAVALSSLSWVSCHGF